MWRGAQVTTTHGLSVLAILVTIAAGHWAWQDLVSRRFLSGLALLVLALSGTAYIVVASGARNADHAATRSATIDARNADRTSATGDVKRARVDHGTAKAEETKECVKIGRSARSAGGLLTRPGHTCWRKSIAGPLSDRWSS